MFLNLSTSIFSRYSLLSISVILPGKVDRLKRVYHELLELINSRSDVLESALRETLGEETFDDIETTALLAYEKNAIPPGPIYRNSPKSTSKKSYNIGKDKDGNVINMVDPALAKMEQYDVKKGTSVKQANDEDKISIINMRQALFGRDKVKILNTSFVEEGKTDTIPETTSRRRFSDMKSQKSLFDLENQTEARSFAASDGVVDPKALTMVVTHLVKWEKTLEFESWIQLMFEEM